MRSGPMLRQVLLGGAIIGTWLVASAHAQFQLYDDFSGRHLDETKWYGEQSATGGPGGLELVRRLDPRHRLLLQHRVTGGRETDTGRHISRNRLRMTDTQTVTGMQFDAQVRGSHLVACEADGASASAARLRGVLFLWNDGSSRWDGDAKGDMGTVVEVYRSTDTDRRYRVRGFLFRCLTSGCGTSEVLESMDLGTARPWEVVTLGMQWEPERDTVAFWKNQDIQSITYTQEDATPAVSDNKRLELRVEAGNCTGQQTVAEMTALVDQVKVQRSNPDPGALTPVAR